MKCIWVTQKLSLLCDISYLFCNSKGVTHFHHNAFFLPFIIDNTPLSLCPHLVYIKSVPLAFCWCSNCEGKTNKRKKTLMDFLTGLCLIKVDGLLPGRNGWGSMDQNWWVGMKWHQPVTCSLLLGVQWKHALAWVGLRTSGGSIRGRH